MASRRFYQKPPTDLATELGPEDGIDPRWLPTPRGRIANRKALQLCRQVWQTLSACLEGEILRDLLVESVVPAPDSSRLLVTVRYLGPQETALAEIHAALRAASVRLRSEIAATIHRRKTPELSFRVLRGNS
jgi:ribosome-binding factor A